MNKENEKRIQMYLKEISSDTEKHISSFLRIMSYKSKIEKLDKDNAYKTELDEKLTELKRVLKKIKKYEDTLDG